MPDEIRHSGNSRKFIDNANDNDKQESNRLMGFGHHVYKINDPRATINRKAWQDLIGAMKLNQPMFEIALEPERIGLEDDYFVSRKLCPDVDCSDFIYRAMKIPSAMVTVMFARARSAGWIAQWIEMLEDPEFRIGRPSHLYIGRCVRDYTPINERN